MNTLARRIAPLAAATLLAPLLVGGAPGASAQETEPETVTITNLDSQGWEIESDPIGDAAIGFQPAPDVDLENHPAPPGNLMLVTGDPEPDVADPDLEGDIGTARITNTEDVAEVTLGELTLEYSTLVRAEPDGSEVAPYLILDIELAAPEAGSPTPVPATLVFEPQYTGEEVEPGVRKSLEPSAWQSWNATHDDALWWSLNFPPSLATQVCAPMERSNANDMPFTCTWDEITDSPFGQQARVTSLSIGIGDPLVGGDDAWVDVEAYADALLVGRNTGTRLYDFEHEVPPAGTGDGHDAFALGDGNNEIRRFDIAQPLTILDTVVITGFENESEELVGIDFDPTSGALFGVTVEDGGSGRVYDLGAGDGDLQVVEQVMAAAFPLPGESFGVSFDAVPDAAGHHLLHVVSDDDVHLTVDVEAGVVTTQAPLAHAPSPGDDVQDPRVVSLTHAADGDGGQEALAAELPDAVPHLVEIPQPAGGVLSDRGALTGVLADVSAGFDSAADGTAFAAFSRPGSSFSRLYRIDTADPASAAHVGRIGGSVVDSLVLPPTGAVGFEVDSDDVLSGSTTVTVDVEREGGTYGDLTLDVVDATSDEGSADPADYDLKTTEVHFPHGSDENRTVDIEITRPADATGDVDVVLRLEDPRGVGNFVSESHEFTLTIEGQERAVIGFDPSSDDEVPETDDDGQDGTATVAISRDGGDVDQVSALLRVKQGAGTATLGEDYDFPEDGIIVSFPDDDGTPDVVDVGVPVINDVEFEDDETAVFELVDPSAGAELGAEDAEHSLTIEDDEPGDVGFAAETFTVDEGDPIDIVVKRENGNEGDVTVTVTDTGNGSAVVGIDYQSFDPASDTFDGANDAEDRDAPVVTIQTLTNDALTGDRVVDLELTVEGPAAAATVSASVVIRDLSGGDAFALSEDGRLVSFDPADPSRAGSPIEVKDGAGAKVELEGIDFNPHDQQLYGVAVVDDSTETHKVLRVYEIDPALGTGSPVPVEPLLDEVMGTPVRVDYPLAPVLPVQQSFGVDFDASGNVLRVIGSAGQHLVFDATPDTGTWQWTPAGPPLVYAPTDENAGSLPEIAAVAHDENLPDEVSNAPESTAYAVDHENDVLVTIDPTAGLLLTTAFSLGDGITTDERTGLDITTDGRLFGALTDAGTTTLYQIDGSTAEAVGVIAGGPYTDVTFAPSGVLRFADDNVFTIEGEGGTQTFTVERVGGTAGTVTVDFDALSETADVPGDVDVTPGTLTFPAGSTEPQSFELTVVDDDVYEADEPFTLRLSNVTGGAALDSLASSLDEEVTIEDDKVGQLVFDGGPFVADEDAGPAQVRVKRTGGSEGDLTVEVATVERSSGTGPGTEPATEEDYVPLSSGTLVTFPHGSDDRVEIQPVEIVGDDVEELDEVLDVRISNASEPDALSGSLTTQHTIANDDRAGSLKLSAADYSVSEDAGSGVVTLERVDGTDGEISVQFATDDGSADVGSDYTSVDETVTFVHGQATQDVAVPVLDDTALEGDETLVVEITKATDFPWRDDEVVAPSEATVTVRDAEPGSLYAVGRDDDGTGDQRLVRFDTARPDTITANLGEVTGLGTDERLVAIDRRADDGEYYALGVSGTTSTLYRLDTTGASLTSVGTLVDAAGDPFPLSDVAGMAVDPVRDLVRVVDGEGQNLRVEFPASAVTILDVIEDAPVFYRDSSDVPGIASVAFTPAVGGAATQYDLDVDNDRVARQGAEGDTSTTDAGELTQAGFGDVSSGADAGFSVDEHQRLLAAVSTSPSDLWYVDGGHSVGQIGDGLVVDALAATPAEGTVGFTAESFEAEEGETAEATVARTGSTSGERTFDYRVLDEAGSVVHEDEVVLEAGRARTEITAPVEDDDVFRNDLQFSVELTNLVGIEAGKREAALTVIDDDEPTIGLSSEEISVTEGEAVELTLSLSNPTAKETSVVVTTTDGTTKAGSDYESTGGDTVTFPVDEDDAPTVTLTIPTVDDALDEFDETFAIELSDPENADLGTANVTVTVADNDPAPQISIDNANVTESDSGTKQAVFTVSLSALSGKQVSVKAVTFDGTAASGADYTATAGTLTFPPGATTRTLSVPVLGDTVDEPDETFGVLLFRAANASFARRIGVGTVVDDDVPPPPPPPPEVEGETVAKAPVNSQSTPDGRGYWIATDEGDVFGFGNAESFGSLRGAVATANIGAPVVDLTVTAEGDGYWLLDDQGGVFTFGEAPFFGSLPGRVQQGIVGSAEVTDMARTRSGEGYVILDHVGGVHTFGDAEYHGSIPGLRADGQEIGRTRFVSIAVTPDGGGYWIMDRNGGVFTFGNAKYFDSIPGLRAAGAPIGETTFVSLAPTSDGRGYWIVDRHGGVFTFGNAEFHGSIPGLERDGHDIGNAATASIEPAPGGEGYWIFDDVGGVFTFGSARFAGSVPGLGRG